MLSTAVYFESSASPAHDPVPIHHRQPRSEIACTKQSAAPVSAQSSGPSGNTQLPAVTPNTGDRLSAIAANRPARSSATAVPRRNISHVVSANSAMNGARTASGASLENRWTAAHCIHQAEGGWSK